MQDPYSIGQATPPKTAHVLQDTLFLAATRPRLAAACLGHAALPALLERCAAEGGQVGRCQELRLLQVMHVPCARRGAGV